MRYIGNDIVDLRLAAQETPHPRFIPRVFTKAEQTFIQEADNPEQMLWLLWSAKEAAYKIMRKRVSKTVFSHQQFSVTLDNSHRTLPAEIALHVEYQHLSIPLIASINTQRIHTFGEHKSNSTQKTITITPHCQIVDTRIMENVAIHFNASERASIRHSAAAAVRYAIKTTLAETLGIDYRRIHIIRPMTTLHKMSPPLVLIDGKRCDIDLSLSHHGQWGAWIIR